MTAARQALVAACLALALVSVSTAQSAEDQRFTLGVMRGDGVMLPFAAYNGSRWSTPWPSGIGAGVTQELPANLEAVPDDWWGSRIPAHWQLWRPGAPPAPFKPVVPIAVPVGRLRRLAL